MLLAAPVASQSVRLVAQLEERMGTLFAPPGIGRQLGASRKATHIADLEENHDAEDEVDAREGPEQFELGSSRRESTPAAARCGMGHSAPT